MILFLFKFRILISGVSQSYRIEMSSSSLELRFAVINFLNFTFSSSRKLFMLKFISYNSGKVESASPFIVSSLLPIRFRINKFSKLTRGNRNILFPEKSNIFTFGSSESWNLDKSSIKFFLSKILSADLRDIFGIFSILLQEKSRNLHSWKSSNPLKFTFFI